MRVHPDHGTQRDSRHDPKRKCPDHDRVYLFGQGQRGRPGDERSMQSSKRKLREFSHQGKEMQHTVHPS